MIELHLLLVAREPLTAYRIVEDRVRASLRCGPVYVSSAYAALKLRLA
jgi:hypothetical protein